MKPFGEKSLVHSIKIFPHCPKRGIYRSRLKLSETIDQDIKLWWLSNEGSMWPFRGRLNSENGLICPPPSPPTMLTILLLLLLLLLRLVYNHKTPVGNFSQGWWWLSWVHQITGTADQTNYANICSAPASYILTWKRFPVFSHEGICIGRKRFSFLMSGGECTPWQNLISGALKRLSRGSGARIFFLILSYSQDIAWTGQNWHSELCLVFQFWGYRCHSVPAT